MRKIICLLTALAMGACLFAGCGNQNQPAQTEPEDKISVVATIFPVYDWAKQILGDRAAELTLLLDSGVDLHSYQPTVEDMVKIAGCDLFLYVGGESDGWVADALRNAPGVTAVNLMEALGDRLKTEETVEGMETEAAEEEDAYDEHIWLSLRNAAVCCEAIRDALSGVDGDNRELYRENTRIYTEKLQALDGQYQTLTENAAIKTVLFADRFPFRYMTEDYGLTYFAAFSGCSAESEASFETVAFLATKLDELGLPVVLTLEGSDHEFAKTVVSTSLRKTATILAMDSMQSVTGKDVTAGADYLNIMEKNRQILKIALQGAA